MFGAMLSAFWAYDGWSNISFVTGEIKNPKRNVPLAIICGVGIAMLLYVLVNYAYMHVLSLPQLAAVDKNTIGAVVVTEEIIGAAGKTLIVALIMVSVFGTLNGIILAHSRVYFRMAQEKYFFKKGRQCPSGLPHPLYIASVHDDLEQHTGYLRHLRYAHRHGDLCRFSFLWLIGGCADKNETKRSH